MKKLLYLLIVLPILALGQSTDQNYVKTTVYRDSLAANPASKVTYFDGLGRPIQQIAGKQSATGKDIITHIAYDSIGRQPKEYLPFASVQNDLGYSDGVTLPAAVTVQYQTKFGDTIPYSRKLFEHSPLNRVLKQAAPGNAWRMDGGHEVRFDYQTNDYYEVRRVDASATWNSSTNVYDISVANISYYDHNQLYKIITKDENWISGKDHTTEEFKDKEGHVVLKRTYSDYSDIYGTLITAEVPHNTYYVYDDYGNLTYVLPPLADPGSVDQNMLDNLCYQYKYDQRNRLVEKKLPGKQWEYIVYNSQDKPLATGPALNPFGGTDIGWLITKYDVNGRVVYTGWYQGAVSSSDRNDFQNSLSDANWYENFTSSTATIDGILIDYTNDTYPTTGFNLLTINYYDGYTYDGAPGTIPTTVEGQIVLVNTKGLATGSWVRVLQDASQYNGESNYTLYDKKSRPIRTYTQNYLGGFTQVDTALDFAGKTLHTITTHKRDSGSILLTVADEYTYTAQDRLSTHAQKINSLATENIVVNSYDELGQLVGKDVGGTGTALQKVSFGYNIRGWLKSINDISNLTQNSDPTDLFAFKINYNDPDGLETKPLYNGNISQTVWRTSTDNVLRRYRYDYDGLNRLNSAVYQKPEFNFATPGNYNESMTYDKNGNIQKLQRNGDWDSDDVLAGVNQIDDLSYDYDPDMQNRLLKVTDNSTSPKGFKDETANNTANDTGTINDYGYDDFGNMISDDNKGITDITYNHLNLPTAITFGSGATIEYLYDATGKKQRKTVTDGTTVIMTDYLDGFQYTNGILNFFPHAEGYVNVTVCTDCDKDHQQNKFDYVYQYKDHLGNIRLSYGYDKHDEVLKIIEENHYYPFGLKHTNYNSGQKGYTIVEEDPEQTKIKPIVPGDQVMNKYKFQGQERQDELGLNWDSFKYRNYDYAIGRFMCIDPLTEKYNTWSPYAFSGNRVVDSRELEGLEPVRFNKKDSYTNLVVVNFGYDGANPPAGKTQTQNANGAPVTSAGLGSLQDLNSDTTKVLFFNSSFRSDTKNDISSTISSFNDAHPDGNVTAVGHSKGADNLVEAVNDNSALKVNNLITLDISDPIGVANSSIPSNVNNATNYYENNSFLGGTMVQPATGNTTSNVTNINSPDSTHTTIDDNKASEVHDIVNGIVNPPPTVPLHSQQDKPR